MYLNSYSRPSKILGSITHINNFKALQVVPKLAFVKNIEIGQSFLYNGSILKKINKTFTALIPKSDHNSKSSNCYRFISLCNVYYTITAKKL